MKTYQFGSNRDAAYGFAWNMVHSGFTAQVVICNGQYEVKSNG